VGVATLAAVEGLRARSMAHLQATQRYEDVYYVPPPHWLPVMSLGFDRALADLLWIRALLYFGEEVEHRGDVEHAYDYADAILALDPDFRRVYRWIAMAAMYRPGGFTIADVRRGIDYLELGVERFPDDGELAWDLGASLAHELAPHLEDPEEKREARRRGVAHMQAAARRGAGPPWLVLSNASQLLRLGQTEQAIRHLEEMYASVDDPDVRRGIERRLAELRSQAAAEALRQTVQELEARRATSFPYVPPGLFLLLGERPPEDLGAGLRRGYVPAPATVDDAPEDPAPDAPVAPGDPGNNAAADGPAAETP